MKLLASYLILLASLFLVTKSFVLVERYIKQRTHQRQIVTGNNNNTASNLEITTNSIPNESGLAGDLTLPEELSLEGGSAGVSMKIFTAGNDKAKPLQGLTDDKPVVSGLKRPAVQGMGREDGSEIHHSKQGSHHLRQKKRLQGQQKQHHRFLRNGKRACKTTTEYVALEKAHDMYGDTVQIAPLMSEDGGTEGQFFHLSYCDVENCNCHGIDSNNYESACQTNYMLTYAKVIKGGVADWSRIKVPAGCSCVVKKRQQHHQTNILDLI